MTMTYWLVESRLVQRHSQGVSTLLLEPAYQLFARSIAIRLVFHLQLVLFVISAVGCRNLIPPEDAWIKREDDKIIIGCYTSRQTWQLRCHDGRWTGVVSNCSHAYDASKGNLHYMYYGGNMMLPVRCPDNLSVVIFLYTA